jgi:hypothetical protein
MTGFKSIAASRQIGSGDRLLGKNGCGALFPAMELKVWLIQRMRSAIFPGVSKDHRQDGQPSNGRQQICDHSSNLLSRLAPGKPQRGLDLRHHHGLDAVRATSQVALAQNEEIKGGKHDCGNDKVERHRRLALLFDLAVWSCHDFAFCSLAPVGPSGSATRRLSSLHALISCRWNET